MGLTMFTNNVIIDAILVYLPAMVSNAVPVFIKKGTPLDRGKLFIDGRRILGDGKTIEGFITGLYFGFIVSTLYAIMLNDYILLLQLWASSIGALLGDIIGSFVKRRMGIPRGGKAIGLDQLDFYIGANALLVATMFNISTQLFIVGLVIVMILHIATNRVAYILGLKNVPW